MTKEEIDLLMSEIGDWSQFHEDSTIERWLHEKIKETKVKAWKFRFSCAEQKGRWIKWK